MLSAKEIYHLKEPANRSHPIALVRGAALICSMVYVHVCIFFFWCMYIYTYMHIYMYTHKYVKICMHTHIHTRSTHKHTHLTWSGGKHLVELQHGSRG